MKNDADLLRQYLEDGSDAAFSELVRRHVNFVYATALRMTRAPHRAEDVTQSVFTDLCRKARSLANRRDLAGWLYLSCRFAAAKLVRADIRSSQRDQHVYLDHVADAESADAIDWNQLEPVLDEVLEELPQTDRDAVLLRYFKDASYAEIGNALGMTENNARMRTARAILKARKLLAKQGIGSTAAALELALLSQPALAAPTVSVTEIAGTALKAGAGSAAGGFPAISLLLMNASKISIGILSATTIAACLVAVHEQSSRKKTETRLQIVTEDRNGLRRQLTAVQARLSQADAARQAGRSVANTRSIAIAATAGDGTSAYSSWNGLSAKQQLEVRHGRFFKSLALDPDKLDRLEKLMIEHAQQVKDAMTAATQQGFEPGSNPSSIAPVLRNSVVPIDQEVRSLIGDAAYSQLLEFDRTLSKRSVANQLQQALSATDTPLSDDEAEALIQALAQNIPKARALPFAVSVGGPLFPIGSTVIKDQDIELAASVLSPQQLEALKTLRQSQPHFAPPPH